MEAFPAFYPLSGRRVIIAGDGEGAEAKARLFRGSPAEVIRLDRAAALDPAAYLNADLIFVASYDNAFVAAAAADVIHVKTPDLGGVGSAVEALLLARDAGLEAFCGGTCNETDRSAQVSAHLAMACEATQVLAKPGMGVDEGLMIVANEMARTAALVRARKAARP